MSLKPRSDCERIALVINDYASVDLPEKSLAMLEYAIDLTLDPCRIDEKDIISLRDFGFMTVIFRG